MMVIVKVMATKEMIKCSNLKRRKRKTKTKEIKANVSNMFLF